MKRFVSLWAKLYSCKHFSIICFSSESLCFLKFNLRIRQMCFFPRRPHTGLSSSQVFSRPVTPFTTATLVSDKTQTHLQAASNHTAAGDSHQPLSHRTGRLQRSTARSETHRVFIYTEQAHSGRCSPTEPCGELELKAVVSAGSQFLSTLASSVHVSEAGDGQRIEPGSCLCWHPAASCT